MHRWSIRKRSPHAESLAHPTASPVSFHRRRARPPAARFFCSGRAAPSSPTATQRLSRKMARRTRDYRRAYADPDAASGGSYEMVERLRRTFKTHRAARWSSTSTSSETPERERRERGRGGSEGRRVGGRGSETEAAGKQRTRESASGSAVDGTARDRCRSGCMPPRSWRGGEAREQQNSPPATQVEIGESLGTTCGGKGTAVGAAVGRPEGGAPKCHARAAGLGARARVAARQTPPGSAAADQYRGVGQCARSTARGGCARGSAGSRALGGSSR